MDGKTEIPTGQLTYMPRAGEIAVLFRWALILQHGSVSRRSAHLMAGMTEDNGADGTVC